MKKRRLIRQYLDTKVENEKLEKMMEVGIFAPVLVEDKQLKLLC